MRRVAKQERLEAGKEQLGNDRMVRGAQLGGGTGLMYSVSQGFSFFGNMASGGLGAGIGLLGAWKFHDWTLNRSPQTQKRIEKYVDTPAKVIAPAILGAGFTGVAIDKEVPQMVGKAAVIGGKMLLGATGLGIGTELAQEGIKALVNSSEKK